MKPAAKSTDDAQSCRWKEQTWLHLARSARPKVTAAFRFSSEPMPRLYRYSICRRDLPTIRLTGLPILSKISEGSRAWRTVARCAWYVSRGKHLKFTKPQTETTAFVPDDATPAIGGLKPCANLMYDLLLTASSYDEIVCVVLTGMGMTTSKNCGADIVDRRPEDDDFWQATGKRVAYRNLWISVPCSLCGFAASRMWGIITVQMMNLGFPFLQLSSSR